MELPSDRHRSNLSLFENVMEDAINLVYDGAIGQFVEKETIRKKIAKQLEARALAQEQLVKESQGGSKARRRQRELSHAVEPLHGIDSEFEYVKLMQREKGVMMQKIRHSEKKPPSPPPISTSTVSQNASESCALCQRKFSAQNLVGVVPFRAVAEWRERHGAPFPRSDRRLTPMRKYDAAHLCVFCTQFFDADFAAYLNYHRNATDINDPVLELETLDDDIFRMDTSGIVAEQNLKRLRRRRRKPPLDPKITKRLAALTGPHGAAAARKLLSTSFDDLRPHSALKHRMAMEALRTRATQPLSMRQLGSELARVYGGKKLKKTEKSSKFLKKTPASPLAAPQAVAPYNELPKKNEKSCRQKKRKLDKRKKRRSAKKANLPQLVKPALDSDSAPLASDDVSKSAPATIKTKDDAPSTLPRRATPLPGFIAEAPVEAMQHMPAIVERGVPELVDEGAEEEEYKEDYEEEGIEEELARDGKAGQQKSGGELGMGNEVFGRDPMEVKSEKSAKVEGDAALKLETRAQKQNGIAATDPPKDTKETCEVEEEESAMESEETKCRMPERKLEKELEEEGETVSKAERSVGEIRTEKKERREAKESTEGLADEAATKVRNSRQTGDVAKATEILTDETVQTAKNDREDPPTKTMDHGETKDAVEKIAETDTMHEVAAPSVSAIQLERAPDTKDESETKTATPTEESRDLQGNFDIGGGSERSGPRTIHQNDTTTAETAKHDRDTQMESSKDIDHVTRGQSSTKLETGDSQLVESETQTPIRIGKNGTAADAEEEREAPSESEEKEIHEAPPEEPQEMAQDEPQPTPKMQEPIKGAQSDGVDERTPDEREKEERDEVQPTSRAEPNREEEEGKEELPKETLDSRKEREDASEVLEPKELTEDEQPCEEPQQPTALSPAIAESESAPQIETPTPANAEVSESRIP